MRATAAAYSHAVDGRRGGGRATAAARLHVVHADGGGRDPSLEERVAVHEVRVAREGADEEGAAAAGDRDAAAVSGRAHTVVVRGASHRRARGAGWKRARGTRERYERDDEPLVRRAVDALIQAVEATAARVSRPGHSGTTLPRAACLRRCEAAARRTCASSGATSGRTRNTTREGRRCTCRSPTSCMPPQATVVGRPTGRCR